MKETLQELRAMHDAAALQRKEAAARAQLDKLAHGTRLMYARRSRAQRQQDNDRGL